MHTIAQIFNFSKKFLWITVNNKTPNARVQ